MKRTIIVLLSVCLSVFGAYAPADTVCVDQAGTGNATQGLTWATAVTLDTAALMTKAAGTVMLIMGGTHTPGKGLNLAGFKGSRGLPSVIQGLKAGTTHGCNSITKDDIPADTADMPLIDMTNFRITFPDTCWIRNCRIVGDTVIPVTGGSTCIFYGCVITNDTNAAGPRRTFQAGVDSKLIRCIVKGANCSGAYFGAYNVLRKCIFEFPNATYGTAIDYNSGAYEIVDKCIIIAGKTGIELGGDDKNYICNNLFWINPVAINATDSYGNTIEDNIACSTSTDFTVWTSEVGSNWVNNNHVDSLAMFNLTDTVSYWKDWNAEFGDFLINPTTFTISSTSSKSYKDTLCEPMINGK